MQTTCCALHDEHNNKGIAHSIAYIMFKYIVLQVNRKLKMKDSRENNIIDNYIKLYGPKLSKL